MSDPALGLLMLTLIVVVIMMGFPTAFTLMGLGIFFGFIAFYDPIAAWTDNSVFDLMVQRTYGAMTNDVLISIPLFVLMGYVMERGALVDKMFYSIQLAFRRVPASLAVATLIVCTFWGIASGLVGAVVVLMGVIAFNPMLKAGYDVKLASGVITAGGTLGILIPPSVMIIVYAAVAGQSVVKLYAAAMFPGFFLSFLYLIYIVGWAMINPKIAPPLPEEQTRFRCRPWMRKFQAAYSRNMLSGLIAALLSPARARAIETRKAPVTYWMLLQEFRARWCRSDRRRHAGLASGGTSLSTSRRRHRSSRSTGVQQLGTPELDAERAARPRRTGAAGRTSTRGSGIIGCLRAAAASYYWQHGRRAARGREAPDLVGDAARHPHRRRARRDPVRHHDRDRVRRRRRGRRLPAGVAGAHARLEAHQGGGVPDRQDHRHGVLAVRRLGAVLGGVRDPRRAGAGRAMGARRST